MSCESMNYVRSLIEKAYYNGAWDTLMKLLLTDNITYGLAQRFLKEMKAEADAYAKELTINKKALRCGNSERARGEEGFGNLLAETTTPDASSQLPPLAADLEGLAVSLGVLAGRVSAEQWEFLRIFRANLRSAAERVAALENSLEVPHERA